MAQPMAQPMPQRNYGGDAFQRLSYDPLSYEMDLKQSTKPMMYSLDPIYTTPSCGGNNLCRPSDIGYIGRVGTSIDRQNGLIDTESELKLLNYRASNAPQHKFIPSCSKQSCKTGYPGPEAGGIQFDVMDQDKCPMKGDKVHFPDCPRLRTEYTLTSYPKCDMKGTGVNRFQPLCQDPQHPSRWEHPSEIGINYRMVVKDNHRPCIPKPMDQSSVLPKPLTVKGVPASYEDGANGLPQKKVTITYCTVAHKDYGHKFFCNKSI
jgi:hypothetical protein